MGGLIRVTPEQLQAVGAQIGSGASSIEGSLQQLASWVEPLGSDWAGGAQARFVDLWGQWQRDAASLHTALTDIARLMGQVAASYESTDAQAASQFRV